MGSFDHISINCCTSKNFQNEKSVMIPFTINQWSEILVCIFNLLLYTYHYYSCILSDWNRLFLRDIYTHIYQVLVWPWWCPMIRYCFPLLSCIVQDSLYQNIDTGTMWLCALVSCIQPQSIGLILVCALLWCWVSLYVAFTNFMIECYFIIMVATIIGILMALLLILTFIFGFPVTM